jgi:HK97 family phage major capsid protein
VFGAVVATQKLLGATIYLSRKLLLQSNAEAIIRIELTRAAAALDAAILAGTGNLGQPLGIVGTPGIGGFTGASLDLAALRNGQLDCAAAAEGRPLAMVTTATVADLLARRPRVASSDRMLLEGATADGTVEGIRCMATSNCPTATAVIGDFSSAFVVEFAGGMQIEVDPYTRFKTGDVGVRLLLPVDVMIARPAAFSIATSIT